MATLQQAIAKALAEAAKAATVETDGLPDIRDDPWFYLDIDAGTERLRAYMRQKHRGD